MDIDIKNVESMLEEKKYTELNGLIKSTFSSKLSEKENGAMLVGISSLYLDIYNTINIRYRDSLQEAVDGMKQINAAEKKFAEKIKLAQVKSNLEKNS